MSQKILGTVLGIGLVVALCGCGAGEKKAGGAGEKATKVDSSPSPTVKTPAPETTPAPEATPAPADTAPPPSGPRYKTVHDPNATYGQKDLVCSGPLYKSMEVDGARVRLTFDHVGGGLAARDGKPLDSFEIAGSDGKFVPAQAEIDGRTIVVSSDPVPQPVTVRFAWSNIACPNLMNKEGLPASSFRTGNR